MCTFHDRMKKGDAACVHLLSLLFSVAVTLHTAVRAATAAGRFSLSFIFDHLTYDQPYNHQQDQADKDRPDILL
jgi:hypothetical protein